MIPNLPNFKGLIESYGIDMEEFEAIASGSNAGALMVVLRLENCFLFLIGVLLLIVAYHVSVEQRAMPSLAIPACFIFTAYEEYQMSTNSWQGIKVFQGQFAEATLFVCDDKTAP